MPRNGFRFPVNNWGYLREGIGKIYVCVCVCVSVKNTNVIIKVTMDRVTNW